VVEEAGPIASALKQSESLTGIYLVKRWIQMTLAVT
jgi:hypothetical protein